MDLSVVSQVFPVPEDPVLGIHAERLSIIAQLYPCAAHEQRDLRPGTRHGNILQETDQLFRVFPVHVFVCIQERDPVPGRLLDGIVLCRRKVVDPLEVIDLRPHLPGDLHRPVCGPGVHHDLLKGDILCPGERPADVLLLIFHDHALGDAYLLSLHRSVLSSFSVCTRRRGARPLPDAPESCAISDPGSYCNNWSTPCGIWFACASIACEDCTRMLFLV